MTKRWKTFNFSALLNTFLARLLASNPEAVKNPASFEIAVLLNLFSRLNQLINNSNLQT